MELNSNKGWQDWQKHQPNESPNLLKQVWEASSSYKDDYQPDMERGLGALKRQMGGQQSARIRRISPMNTALRIAAGVAVLLLAGLFLKNRIDNSDDRIVDTTPAGGTVELALSDGSQVTLNQSSQLIYAAKLGSEKREVELNGEAFFKISRDENRPFVIETETAKVTVLGTSFNVRSYPNDEIFEVFVETGRVKVEFKNGQTVELTPGEYIRSKGPSGELVRGTDKSAMSNAWRTGVISLKGQRLPAVFEGMQRLYGEKFDLQTAQNPECLQTLTLEKGKMEEAISVLKASCPNLKFVKKPSGYLVSGTCCD